MSYGTADRITGDTFRDYNFLDQEELFEVSFACLLWYNILSDVNYYIAVSYFGFNIS